MDWLEFSASVVGDVLSWPVAVFVIVFLMRTQLRDLLKRLRRSNVFGQDFYFGDVLERAEVSTAQAAADAESKALPDSEPLSEPEKPEVNDKAQWNPSGVVIAAWERTEAAVRALHRAAGLPTSERRTPVAMSRQLAGAGIVNRSFENSIVQLNQLRSLVAHGRHEPTPGEAAGYAQVANELVRAAESLIPLAERGQEMVGRPDSVS